ncbi:MAG: glutamine amidotransferase family protein [Chloroflexi bacterium]|nr:glutamine amidotransferase family protein [Chloroflexota bacterium]
MKDLNRINNPHGDDKVNDACSIFGMMDTSGRRFGGGDIIKAMTLMHDRGNGLGAGFAVYGLYPNFPQHYAFHIMYLSREAQQEVESFLQDQFCIDLAEEVPTQPTPAIVDPPLIRRYFALAHPHRLEGRREDDYVVSQVMRINTQMDGAFVFSSGKDMGVFKGVGYPEDVAQFYRLETDYQGYLWTGHSRFPTNTPGWWGGAHPFSILDWTVIHNGEISSYGINRRYLEMYGYHCTMHTDTEVIAYAVDLLIRQHELPLEVVADILAPPLWSEIDRQGPEKKEFYTTLRQVYGSLLLNGPFTIVVAHRGEMIGLTDRIRLRPLTAATRGDMLYLSSEESAIRLVSPKLDRAWIPMGGEPIVGRLKASLPTKAAKAAVKESISH